MYSRNVCRFVCGSIYRAFRYTHDNTHVAPTLHPQYTHVAPVDISVCPQNVCKIVCVAGMYVIFYVVQLTVLLLNSVHPSYTRLTPAGVEHPHLHPRDFADTVIFVSKWHRVAGAT